MPADAATLKTRLDDLEAKFQAQEQEQKKEAKAFETDLDELKRYATSLQVVGKNTTAGHFARRIEWTIKDFSKKVAGKSKGEGLMSPKFSAAGLDGLQIELLPKGGDNTIYDGFCSIFMFVPVGTNLKYQFWVGSFERGPNEDKYEGHGRTAHGHSNFCLLEPQIDKETDSLKLGVNILKVASSWDVGSNGLRVISKSLESVAEREAQVFHNADVTKVVWKIRNFSARLKQFPQGGVMYSPPIIAAGVGEILLEFYPNGRQNTQKAGFCAFYIRCPDGTTLVVTLFVGGTRKGPIKTTFEDSSVGATGKGLPDFCLLDKEINKEDDTLEVGAEITHEPSKTIHVIAEC